MNRLTLDLPVNYQLMSDRGLVTKVETMADRPESDLQRWVIQLGGCHQFNLIVASKEAMRQRTQLVSLQQDTVYRVAEDGLVVSL